MRASLVSLPGCWTVSRLDESQTASCASSRARSRPRGRFYASVSAVHYTDKAWSWWYECAPKSKNFFRLLQYSAPGKEQNTAWSLIRNKKTLFSLRETAMRLRSQRPLHVHVQIRNTKKVICKYKCDQNIFDKKCDLNFIFVPRTRFFRGHLQEWDDCWQRRAHRTCPSWKIKSTNQLLSGPYSTNIGKIQISRTGFIKSYWIPHFHNRI
jgi:hypothetical protein